MSPYGKRGGEGPTRGQTATKYLVTLPDGTQVIKRIFRDLGEGGIATGFYDRPLRPGKPARPVVVVWDGEPAWEGDFGRLQATRIK